MIAITALVAAYLHSNMSLLIFAIWDETKIKYHNLHSNMSLLISSRGDYPFITMTLFTFQYVSINMNKIDSAAGCMIGFTFQYVSINIVIEQVDDERNTVIYIPICLY